MTPLFWVVVKMIVIVVLASAEDRGSVRCQVLVRHGSLVLAVAAAYGGCPFYLPARRHRHTSPIAWKILYITCGTMAFPYALSDSVRQRPKL